MACVIVKLIHDDWKPNSLGSKEEFFMYMDTIFEFFSHSRNDMDHKLFDLYLSRFRTLIDIPQADSNLLSTEICATAATPSLNAFVPSLDNNTIREKRVKALASIVSTETPVASSYKVEENKEIKLTKLEMYKGMRLPAWASQRTRELRANLLGLSVDEV
jgi:ribosomal protein S13